MHDVKDYGIVCDLAANPDVVGLVAPQQVRRFASLDPERQLYSLTMSFLFGHNGACSGQGARC